MPVCSSTPLVARWPFHRSDRSQGRSGVQETRPQFSGILFVTLLCVALTTVSAGATLLRAQQGTGAIVGRITDSSSKAPVPAVQLQIVGTGRGTMAADDGRFTIQLVPAGTLQVRVTRIGYAAQTRTITLSASATDTVDFALVPTQVTLDQVVITPTGETERERQTGNSVSVITTDSVPKAAVATFSELITGQAPGVDVQDASGTVGGGSRIRIRGSNSISLDNTPLLVIDGVYADNNPQSFPSVLGFGVGGQGPSRLDDLDPDEIQSIEVLKGPAATALYGTAGANGVLLVTTKHGAVGRTQWTAHADYGPQTNYVHFPTNYDDIGITKGGQAFDHCTLYAQATGLCTPTKQINFNPLEDPATTPFVTGSRTLAGASVSGGTQALRYYVSGDYDNDHGVYVNNFGTNNNARANLAGSLGAKVDFGVNIGYTQGRAQLPENDNNFYSPILNGVLGSAEDTPNLNGYYVFTPAQLNQIIYAQSIDRWIGSSTATWRALSWLNVTGVAGIDEENRNDFELTPANDIALFGPLTYSGSASGSPQTQYIYTTQLTATANYGITQDLHATSSLGSQYSNTITHATLGFGYGLLPGTTSLAGLTTQFGAGALDDQIVTLGYYGQQQFAWRDRVFVTGSLRADNNSAFGRNLGYQVYPGVSGSWVIGEEPWFPKTDAVNSLRLRAAFGFSGQHPGFLQAQTFYNSIAYHVPETDAEASGVTIGGLGNPNLEPERTGEFEGGFDVGFWHGRVQVEATGYAKDTRNALILAPYAPSIGGITTGPTTFGTSNRYLNLGEVTNRGFELGINSTIINLRDIEFDLNLSSSFNKNKVITLGPGITPILFGLTTAGGGSSQLITPGYPLAGFWQPSVTYSDANHDGIIEPNEVQIGAPRYLGSPIPEQEVSVGPSIVIFRNVRIRALFDNHAVVASYNSTENARCTLTATSQNCAALYNPHAPLWEQARNIADLDGSDAGFIEDASFWKWRELAVTYSAPESWARFARARALSFTIGGHNLKTWTKFTGLDPETTFNGADNYTNTNFFTQPLLEYWTGRIDISF